MNRLQRVLRVVTGEVQAMNMMHTLRRWCLLFAAVATAAFAAPGFAKNFRAELVDAAGQPAAAVPNGTGITIRLKIYNTSTEPATINSIVLCNVPGVILTGVVPGTGSGTLLTYVPSGNDPNVCGPAGGKTLTGFSGIKRQTNKTFQLVATVSATCSSSTWPIFASTGNTFSSVDKFTEDLPLQTAFGCDVVLGSCSPPSSYTEVSGGNTTTIQRFEKPGFPCDPIAFNVLFTNADNTVEIQWVGQAVFLKSTVLWPPALVDPITTQPKLTWVAWETETDPGPNQGLPIYIPVPACVMSDLLTATTDPFPILSSTATLPNGDPNPYAGLRARICAIEEVFSVKPQAEASDCPTQPPGLTPSGVVLSCVQADSVFYINGDVWLSKQ
jgi:hypothetical protein